MDILSSSEFDLSPQDLAVVIASAGKSRVVVRGGNSCIRQVFWKGSLLAVKDYSSRLDAEDRLRRETNGLKLLQRHKIHGFPISYGSDTRAKCGVLSWIPGSPALPSTQTVRAIADVLDRLHGLSLRPNLGDVEEGADSVVDPDDLHRQIQIRGQLLLTSESRDVQKLANSITRFAGSVSHTALIGARCATLSLSDLGCHNTLYDAHSSGFTFIDLEFFGWDDAHKLVLDTLLHPLSEWTTEMSGLFEDSATELYDLNKLRLEALAPLIAAKWALIILARADRQLRQGSDSDDSMALATTYLDLAVQLRKTGWRHDAKAGEARA